MNQSRKNKRLNRRLIRGAIYIVAGLFILAGNRFGWFTPDKTTQSDSSGFEAIQVEKQRSPVSATEIQTIRLEDPKERGETHYVTDDTVVVKTRAHKRDNDNEKIAQLFKQEKSNVWVTAYGRVGKVLPDDNRGSRHQRFLLDIGQQKWLLIAHNIDLAPYVPLKEGDQLVVHGEYEHNDKGGVIHWTHHDPRGYKEGGYIELNNKRYE